MGTELDTPYKAVAYRVADNTLLHPDYSPYKNQVVLDNVQYVVAHCVLQGPAAIQTVVGVVQRSTVVAEDHTNRLEAVVVLVDSKTYIVDMLVHFGILWGNNVGRVAGSTSHHPHRGCSS